MSNEPVTIAFTLGEAEYLRTAMRIHRRKRLPYYVVILVVYGYFILRLGDMPLQVLDPRPIGLVVFGLFLVFVSPLIVRRGLAKAFRSNKRLQEEMQFTFDPEGYVIKGETFSGDNKWTGLHRVQETKDMFLFYHSTLTMNLVPKRAFSDPAQQEAVRRFMAQVPGLQVKRTN
jgi:hypothetical protein